MNFEVVIEKIQRRIFEHYEENHEGLSRGFFLTIFVRRFQGL